MVSFKPKLIHTAIFWLAALQLGWSAYVHLNGSFEAQKGWAVNAIFYAVCHAQRAALEIVQLNRGQAEWLWHGFALMQAMIIGLVIDQVRRLAGLTSGD